MTEAFVEPAYASRSLGDVVPAVAAALGRPIGETPSDLPLPDAPSYVVFLVDGLGARLIQRHRHVAPFLAGLLDGSETGTAGVPSTTATSLTSLGTGLTPGTHGLVGFTSRIPGTEKLLISLFWDKDVDPLEWQPHPTAFSRMQEAGVAVTVVNKREFRGSGLTVASSRGGGRTSVPTGSASGSPPPWSASRAARRSPTSTTATSTGPATSTASPRPSGCSSWPWSTPRSSSCARRCPRRPGSSSWPTTAWSTRRPSTASTSTSTRAARRAAHLRRRGPLPASLLPRRCRRRRPPTWTEFLGDRATC